MYWSFLFVEDFIEDMGPLSTKLGYAFKTGLKLGLFWSGEHLFYTKMVRIVRNRDPDAQRKNT